MPDQTITNRAAVVSIVAALLFTSKRRRTDGMHSCVGEALDLVESAEEFIDASHDERTALVVEAERQRHGGANDILS